MGIQLNPSTPVAGYDPKFDANKVAQNFNREVEVLPPPLYPSWLYITFLLTIPLEYMYLPSMVQSQNGVCTGTGRCRCYSW